jgi:hypothetical protein
VAGGLRYSPLVRARPDDRSSRQEARGVCSGSAAAIWRAASSSGPNRMAASARPCIWGPVESGSASERTVQDSGRSLPIRCSRTRSGRAGSRRAQQSRAPLSSSRAKATRCDKPTRGLAMAFRGLPGREQGEGVAPPAGAHPTEVPVPVSKAWPRVRNTCSEGVPVGLPAYPGRGPAGPGLDGGAAPLPELDEQPGDAGPARQAPVPLPGLGHHGVLTRRGPPATPGPDGQPRPHQPAWGRSRVGLTDQISRLSFRAGRRP